MKLLVTKTSREGPTLRREGCGNVRWFYMHIFDVHIGSE